MKIFSFALFSSVVLGTAAPAAAEVDPRFRPVPVGDVRKLRTSKAFEDFSSERRLARTNITGTSNCVASGNINRGTWQPNLGTVTDPGSNEWNPTDDFLLHMYNQGGTDKVQVGNAYARYDCSTETLCVLALSLDSYYFEGMDEAWLKLYNEGYSGDKPPGDDGITNVTLDGQTGWEGCFALPPGCYESAQIHDNWSGSSSGPFGSTASTGKKQQSGGGDATFGLYLPGCPCTSDDNCTADTTCYDHVCNDGSATCELVSKGDGCCEDPEDDCVPQECQQATCAQDAGEDYPKCSYNAVPGCGDGGSTDDECIVADDCFVTFPEQSPDCAEATCMNNAETNSTECSFSPISNQESKPCGDSLSDNYTRVDFCDNGYQCVGTQCKVTYQDTGTDCTPDENTWIPKLAAGKSASCYTAQCTATASTDSEQTTCEPVQKANNTTKCGYGSGNETRGICDDQDRCVDGACLTIDQSYKPGSPCRPALPEDCCDKTEVCVVDNFDCPEDAFYGDDGVEPKLCRSTCTDCAGDEEEWCPGGQKKCIENIILNDELCITAGQQYDAGTVSIVATAYEGDKITVCATLTLNDDWNVVGGSETIKASFLVSPNGAPGNNAGSYELKYGETDLDAVDKSLDFPCVDLPLSTGNPDDTGVCDGGKSLYFAIHLDVVGPSGGETAWALPCDPPSDSPLTGTPFTNKNGKGKAGWGQFITFSPCCVDDCENTACEGGGGGTNSTTGGGNGCSWTCTGLPPDAGASSGTCDDDQVAQCVSES